MKEFKRTIFDRVFFFLLPNPSARVKYLRKHNVFAELGENVFYQSRQIPVEPYLVKIHNNVSIAADVNIIPHDVINIVFNRKNKNNQGMGTYRIHLGCVEIMDNCFIGSHSVILEGVRIGPNAIVAAGAVITKDVPEGTIVGGNPAKVIGYYDDLMERRRCDIGVSQIKRERAQELWKKFYEERNSNESREI